MYFPYLRGRQYELLALRDMARDGLLSKSIIPVVEPVRLTTTFDTVLRTFADVQNRMALVFNPAVGEYGGSCHFIDAYCARGGVVGHVMPALLMGSNVSVVLSAMAAQGVTRSNIITILDKRDFLGLYKDQFSDTAPQYTLYPDERQIKRAVKRGKVLFTDRFIKQDKNADYAKNTDEFFSDDHLFFEEEGCVGFGDYSIVGNKYDESGFAPTAVAIHIVYFASDDTLRMRHFVSDSNVGTEDVAGKYYEAVTKLVGWYYDGHQGQKTSALSAFLHHYENGYYPGLPTIKKLSVMHHLELVGQYLDGGTAR
ncbi:MAG: sce7725 family protein [Oscillospiraceae bacterium]|jgi:hypothetical protein|nr:sce7725 family protein [Oscillospiraceae bacterium]